MPKLSYFISASAINCYGKESNKIHKESDDFGSNFLSQLIKSWENASDTLASKIPVAKLRIPIVLSKNDGALVRIKKITNFGLGAPLGSGKQTMPWIHIADLCRLFAFAIDKKLVGSYNANAGLDSNKDFMKSVALSMKRPFFFPSVPSFLLKLILGEQACIVLEGIKVSNEKIRAAGFTFQDTTLSSALKKK
jgi:Predicted nucleoside-diphosphate sugar epimerase